MFCGLENQKSVLLILRVIVPLSLFVLVVQFGPRFENCHILDESASIPIFKYHSNSLIDSVYILDLEVSQQLLVYKKCILEAAKPVGADCLSMDP